MKQQLQMLRDLLSQIDEDPAKSLLYYTGTIHRAEHMTPTKNVRYVLIEQALHQIQHSIQCSQNCEEVDGKIPEYLFILDHQYSTHQHYCWKSHEHHFHSSFEQYVNCPITCLAEISEFLEKIQKELYKS